MAISFLSFTLVFSFLLQVSSAVPFDQYILAPSSRIVFPISVYKINGTVSNAKSLISATGTSKTSGTAILNGTSSITFDFGKNVGGIVSVTVGNSSPDAFVALTFSESSLWINGQASDGTADAGLDAPIWLQVGKGPGVYTVEPQFQRGAFRYLSLIGNSAAPIEIISVWSNITFSPNMEDLRAYTGWFNSNDEQLNRIWYAGAYTNQMCTIEPDRGNALVHIPDIHTDTIITLPQTDTWYVNTTITEGTSCLVDGAKRDRDVYPGDMAIQIPSVFVSTNDMYSVKNSINSLLALQLTDGRLPEAGPPISNLNITSFTYHLYNLIAVANYYHYTGDVNYLRSVWDRYTKGLAWSLSFIDQSGLMYVKYAADWLRVGMGGHNIEANAILYYTLNQAIKLATTLNETSQITKWTSTAASIKRAANNLLWNEATGFYHDNETTTLAPQDGNSWAIKANLTTTTSQKTNISANLKYRWTKFGAPAPEAGGTSETISPFIGGFELEAHFLANNALTALQLMRRQWGDFMLDDSRMTNSTFIEGYSVDGSLHYAPYTNDARISHAHGWSTGPTSLLSFYVAGIQLTSAGGANWLIAPQLGDLVRVEAGFESPLGMFSNSIKLDGPNGTVVGMNFSTPAGTVGDVYLPGYSGNLIDAVGNKVLLVGGVAKGVKGGDWESTGLIRSNATSMGGSVSNHLL